MQEDIIFILYPVTELVKIQGPKLLTVFGLIEYIFIFYRLFIKLQSL